MGFPTVRMRRLRRKGIIRDMVAETSLSPLDFIYPVFAVFGKDKKEEIPSMPGIYRYSVDLLPQDVREAYELGIPAVIVFGIPEHKDPEGSGAYAKDGIAQQAVKAIKDAVPDIVVIADVCMCEYTSHGHCGILTDTGEVDNDRTLEKLAETAVSLAEAGADIVAPSDMMDGRVSAIRKALDENGFSHVIIMSYAAKYASAFYGPFRDAAESAPAFGDRRGYQMDPRNSDEALREVALDIEEGADIVMVKPALAYLDVIYRVKKKFKMPVAAYNVSGEYSLVKAGGKLGWVDEKRIMMEILHAIKRAGADLILTYFAKEAVRALEEKGMF